MRYIDHNYSDGALNFDLCSIRSLHIYSDMCFLKRVELNYVDSREIIHLFERFLTR